MNHRRKKEIIAAAVRAGVKSIRLSRRRSGHVAAIIKHNGQQRTVFTGTTSGCANSGRNLAQDFRRTLASMGGCNA